MIGWIVRVLMIAGGVLTGWFLAGDAPLFGVVQIFVTLFLMALIVALFAFWPPHAGERLNRLFRRR
jgi:hypothetical protein